MRKAVFFNLTQMQMPVGAVTSITKVELTSKPGQWPVTRLTFDAGCGPRQN